MPGSVRDVARPGPSTGGKGFKGFKGSISVSTIEMTLEVVPYVLQIVELKPFFLLRRAKGVRWVDKDVSMEPNQKPSKFR